MLRDLWAAEGVDDRWVTTDLQAFTAIYFVTHDAAGHHFHFFRAGSAASRVSAQSVDVEAAQSSRVFHLSGISLAISSNACDAGFALIEAARAGFEVYVWFAGLATPELHIKRVRARVKRGGHDIPEAAIRRRFEHSRVNLITLMPHLAGLRVFDNSAEADPAEGKTPAPLLVLHMQHGRVIESVAQARALQWAKPILAAAYKQHLALGSVLL